MPVSVGGHISPSHLINRIVDQLSITVSTMPHGQAIQDEDEFVYKDCISREHSIEPQESIFVKSVSEGSPAYYAGLSIGDRIVAVNGDTVSNKTYQDIIAAIKQSNDILKLLVVPKDEDILQMAYSSQTGSCMVSSSSTFPDFRLPGLNNCHQHHSRSSSDIVHKSTEQGRFYSNENLSFDRHEVRHSYPLSQWGVNEANLRLEDFSFDLQCHRAEPLRSDGNPAVTRSNKQQSLAFQDQESVMASNAAYSIPGKPKYSFGIYYPPNSVNIHTGSNSAGESMSRGYEDSPQQLSAAKPHTFDMNQNPATAHRKKSLDESSALSSSARSRDFLIRYPSERAADDIKSRYSPRHLVYERSVDNRPANSMSRSQTMTGISPLNSSNPEQSLKQLSDCNKSGSENSLHTNQSQQYIPVYSGNKLPSGEDNSSRGSSVDNCGSSVHSEQSDPSSQLKTYTVRLPYEQQRCQQSRSTESSSTPTRQRFGTSCARTPTVMHIELQKSIGKPIVSQRKYQFESGKNENTHVPGVSGFNRYKTEIEKIRTQPKFSSVALRKASFEQSPDRDPPGLDDSVEYEKLVADYSGSIIETAQPTVKAKSSFMERYNTPIPHQSSENKDKPFSLREHYQENVPTKAGMPVGSTQCSTTSISGEGTVQPLQEDNEQSLSKSTQFQPSADEHFHPQHHDGDASHGSVGVAGCDISTGSLADSGVWMRSYCGSSDMLDAVDAVSGVSDSGVFSLCGSTTDQEVSSIHLSRPSRKPSYLSAINAPVQRLLSESDSISLSDHPDGQITTEEMFPDGLNASVTMRKKFQESLEDQTSKLHRRTSYLMATARDRTNNAPLEMSFSSPHVITDHALDQGGGSLQHNSSVKLNRFFGEMIPSIAEVAETRLSDHEDPLEVIRKGPLLCKISVIEGKKCSDRTWKPVYAILRPTELFLTRDKDSGFTSNYFEDQHIPLKLCMVEFARDYAKKKKNVFRMSTYNECEYLFQAEDRGTLMCWIQGIKTINEPMKTDKMDETTSEKEKQLHSPVDMYAGLSNKMSPQLVHKGRKLSALSFKSKLASSPNMKRKKSNAADKEEVIKKGWMDRIPMMKSLKKHNEDTGLPLAEQDMDSNKFQFGVPLEYCFPSPHNENVPLIVELCTRIVEARGLECVGVYRVPGNSAAVNALTEEFNRGIDSVNIDNEKLLDINVISSLLKSFFRKLPEPLIPTDAYDEFIEANRCPDESKRKLKLKRLLHLLPAHHNETFKHMAEHLNKVASYGHLNKMDAKNLAIMFGPTLVRKNGDDTVSLVTDMSDQCRIVESIILHHEWFFGPWDQDSYIPMETTVETVPVDDGQFQSKDDDEEADSAISTKEIISSIVGAASKKLRQKQQKKSLESLDMVDSSSIASTSTYKDHSKDDSFNLTLSMASISSSLSDSEEYSSSKLSIPSSPYLQPYRPDPVNKDFKKSEYPAVSYQASPNFSRPQQNSDFLGDKHDELETSHQPAGLSQDAISRLKRIGDDVSALLHTFEQKQMIEREHRRREKEMVERDLLRTQLELEQEENHSVDDWLEWKGSLTTAKMPDLVSSSYIGDKFSYNQNQSGLVVSQEKKEQNQRKMPLGVQPDSERSSQSLTSLLNYSSYKAGLAQAEATAFSQSRMSRGGSHEDILSQCRNMGYDAVRPVVIRGPCQRRLQENQQKAMHLTAGGAGGYPASLRNSLGRRHGSLDSLIDMIDKQEKRASWASSDSEDGSDLLSSITATFDQKLQVLLNPKYKLTGTGKRCSRNETAGSTNEGILDWQNDNIQAKAAAITNTKQIYTVNTLLDSARSYRDPSLHRSARSDPKIGIASRFERNDITRTTSSSPVTSSSNTATNLGKWSKRQLPDFKAFLGKQTSHFKDSNSVILTKPKKLESRINKTRNVSDKRESGLAFKSSQAWKNQILNPSKNEAKFFLGEKPPAGREKFKEETTETIHLGARPRYRRHTVGGVEDLAHINALSQVCSEFNLRSYPTSRDRLSAWDQLRPAVNAPGSRNMQAWIQRERLRGSTPDLSVAGLF